MGSAVMMPGLLRLLLAFALLLAHGVVSCPSVCRCIGQKRVSVYCDYKGLQQTVPANIPLETTHLYLMGNKFTSVLPGMFLGNAQNSDGSFVTEQSALTNLTVIRLDLNPISVVNEHAFERGPSLKLIYLPFDVKITRQAFAEMKDDKDAFDGFTRVVPHPLEDPLFVAFSKY